MPWRVGRRTKRGYPIIRGRKGQKGKVVGYSKSKQKAQASVRARYTNYRR